VNLVLVVKMCLVTVLVNWLVLVVSVLARVTSTILVALQIIC